MPKVAKLGREPLEPPTAWRAAERRAARRRELRSMGSEGGALAHEKRQQ